MVVPYQIVDRRWYDDPLRRLAAVTGATVAAQIGAAIRGGFPGIGPSSGNLPRKRPAGSSPGGAAKRPRPSGGGKYITNSTAKRKSRFKIVRKRKFITRFKRSGRSSRKYRRKVKPKVNHSKMGTILRRETGGIVSSSGCVYVGHINSPIKMVWRSFGQALVRKFMNMAKLSFVSWDEIIMEGIANNFNIVIQYKDVVDQAVGQVTFVPTVGDTYHQMANALTNQFLALIASTQNKLEILDLYIKNQNSATAVMASMRLKGCDLKVHIKSSSVLKMQNLTQNTSVSTDLSAQHSAVDIRNNPLTCKMYQKYGNYMATKYYEFVGVTSPPVFIGENVDGIVKLTSTDASLPTKMQTILKNPPLVSFFEGKVKSAKSKLAPGGIMYSKLLTEKTFTLNGFIAHFLWAGRLFNTLASMDPSGSVLTQRVPHAFGGIKVYAFEKIMDQRSDEPNTNVAYEVDNTMMITITGSVPVAAQPDNNY